MSRGRIKSITALYAVSVAAALLFGQAGQATSVVITEFDFTLTLSAVRLEDGSDASPTDYLPDELVSAGEHSRNFSAGVASGTGSVAATFNGQPVDDTQPLLLNDTVRTILTTESMTSGPGGVGQRNQFADIFFAFSNESAQDLTFVFDWVAKWDIETINSVAGDQAVGRVGTLITIATGGLETEIELFPWSSPEEIIGFNLEAGTTNEIDSAAGTFNFVLSDEHFEAGVLVEVEAVSNPRINVVPLPAGIWLLGAGLAAIRIRVPRSHVRRSFRALRRT